MRLKKPNNFFHQVLSGYATIYCQSAFVYLRYYGPSFSLLPLGFNVCAVRAAAKVLLSRGGQAGRRISANIVTLTAEPLRSARDGLNGRDSSALPSVAVMLFP
jgi:hypothetical protein